MNHPVYDASVEIRVVMGSTSLTVKNILGLGEGSLINLNKEYQDPVDIYINNKLFAKGEVVSVDDNFGVRIVNMHI